MDARLRWAGVHNDHITSASSVEVMMLTVFAFEVIKIILNMPSLPERMLTLTAAKFNE